jgi:VRR-NUC domain
MRDEWIEQVIVCEWLKQKHPHVLFWHTPNEGMIPPQYRKKLLQMGLLSGVSDLFFPAGNKGYSGLVVEMKRLDGKVSKPQKDFIDKMRLLNYFSLACYGSDEAIEIIRWFYELQD